MDINFQVEGARPAIRAARRVIIETLTAEDFWHEVLEQAGPVAVEFMSYSCAHCGQIDPVVREVATALDGAVRICRVNVVHDRALAAEYQVEGTPTFVMFRDGVVVGRAEGPAPVEAVLTELITRPFTT